MEFLLKGGVVVWILIGYSVIGLSIVISGYLRFALRRQPAFNGAHAEQTAEQDPVFQRLISAQQAGMDQASVRALALRLIDAYMRPFERGLKTLNLLANTAPLLGLLGTVMGMISAFQVIESAGAGVDPQMLAGGIWVAMLTTGVGLGVALPLLLFLHSLESLVEKRHWSIYVAVSEVIHEPVEHDRV